MPVVRLFDDQGSFTIVRNALFDVVLPKVKPSSWKILCVIIRVTIGWNKKSEELSFRQLKALTGITSDRILISSLKELREFSPPLIKTKTKDKWKATVYELNKNAEALWEPATKMTVEPTVKMTVEPTVKMTVEPTVKMTVEPTVKMTAHSKYIHKKENINKGEENTSLASPEKREKKSPKKSPQSKPPDPTFRHPFVTIYRELSGFNEIPAAARKLICETITADGTRLEDGQRGERGEGLSAPQWR
jgi:hypothetical protein